MLPQTKFLHCACRKHNINLPAQRILLSIGWQLAALWPSDFQLTYEFITLTHGRARLTYDSNPAELLPKRVVW